jgi:hypothetical protein
MLMAKVISSLFVRKLVNMGRKFCLFLYYVELIDTKLWIAEEAATLNRGLKNRTVESKIGRGIQKQCRQVLLSSSIFKGW